MLENSDAKAVVVEDDEQLGQDPTRSATACPKLEHVIRMDGTGGGAISHRRAGRGRGTGRSRRRSGRQRWQSVTPDDICTFIYTSGTTGPAEGLRDLARQLPLDGRHGARRERPATATTTTYLFLPLAHSFALLIQFLSFDLGGNIAYWERDPLKIIPNLARGEAGRTSRRCRGSSRRSTRPPRRGREVRRPQEARLQLGDRRRQEGSPSASEPASRSAGCCASSTRSPTSRCSPRSAPCSAAGSRTASPAPRRSTRRSCASSTPPASSSSRAGA